MDFKKIAKELPDAIKKVAQETITEQKKTQQQLFQQAMSPKAGRVAPASIKQKVTTPAAPKAPKVDTAIKGAPMTPERAAVLKKDPKLRAEYLSTIGATPTKY